MRNRISMGQMMAYVFCVGTAGNAYAANTAVLNPGVVNGTVNLSGEVVNSGYVNAYSNDGYSSSTGFTGNAFSLTVEGNHAYRLYVDNYINDAGTWKYLQIARYSDYLYVPVNSVVNNPFTYQTADITGNVNVLGGTLNGFYIQSVAYNTVSGVSEQYYSRYYGNGAISLPQIVDDAVDITGYANCTTPYGVTVQVNLTPKTVTVGAGGTVVTWDIDLTNLQPGQAQGLIGLDASPLPDIASGHTVVAYNGDLGWPGNYYSTYRSENGAYGISNLYAADWYLYAYSYFDAPYGQFYWPGSWQTVPAGGTVNYDFVDDLAFIRGRVNVNGFRTNTTISGAQVRSTGPAGTAYDYIDPNQDPTGNFNLAVRPGDSTVDYYWVWVYDYTDSLNPIQVWQQVYNFPAAAPTYTLGDSTELSHPGFVSTQVETTVILDVIEPTGVQPPPPQTLITNPTIYAYEYKQDGAGNYQTYKYFQASGSGTPQARPALRLTAEPGTYSAQVYGYVNGSRALFANFNLTIPSPIISNVGTGTTNLSSDVSLTGTVTNSGVSSVVQTPFGASAPSGFRVNSTSGVSRYYDINTTATYTYPVKVCLKYDDTGLTPFQESLMRIYHYVGGVWVNITTSRDTVNNIVCGNTPSFSPFAVMELNDGAGDGDADGVATLDSFDVELDNCPDIANSNQADMDNDDIGDVCDTDNDNDGIEDSVDNCPYDANANQADSDGDGEGDVCDTSGDSDQDGVLDDVDVCPSTEGGATVDATGCSSAQLLELSCPVSKKWKNHGEYVSCVTKEAKRQATVGLISNSTKGSIVSKAAASNVGN